MNTIWLGSPCLEIEVADGQKFAFRGVASNKGKFIQSGLWQLSLTGHDFGVWSGVDTPR